MFGNFPARSFLLSQVKPLPKAVAVEAAGPLHNGCACRRGEGVAVDGAGVG